MKNAYGYEGEGTCSIEDTKLKIKLKIKQTNERRMVL